MRFKKTFLENAYLESRPVLLCDDIELNEKKK